MRRFNVCYASQALQQLSQLRNRARSAAKRERHDEARILLEAELTHDADKKGWPNSENRRFSVIDESPLRFVFWPDYPNVWIVDVWPIPGEWWHD